MATNTTALKNFAQQTRAKLISLVQTKLQFVLHGDTAELRGFEAQIDRLRKEIASKTEKIVVEEVAYTWFNRVMALRFMDANGYNAPMVVSPTEGQTRPEILQDAMGGSIDEELRLSAADKLLPEAKLYRKLLIAVCNQKNESMPFLFEHISDYSELLLPDDLLSEQSFVYDIRQGMTAEDCQNVEIVGWLYQYYISSENERLIKSKKKYKRDELAPASQLFTPEWIVRYMVDNTLGQLWSEMYPGSKLVDTLEFYIKPNDIESLPKREIKPIEEIRFYDPCVGSAHILSYAYDVFYKMYEELGYQSSEIPRLIIEKNLWGTDIDKRASQLSSFVLTMKARGSYNRIFRKGVLKTNISYYKDFPEDEKFCRASSLGSLITITPEELKNRKGEQRGDDLFSQNEDNDHLDKLYQILGQRYDLVVTNPPYISSSRMDDETKKFVETYYPKTKSDLFATFILRCLELCCEDGLTGYMTPFVWMFISSFEALRKDLIDKHFINNLIQLEYSGFDGATVPVCTFTLRNNILDLKGCYIRLSDFKGSANQAPKTLEAICNRDCGWFYNASQYDFRRINGTPISFWGNEAIYEIFENNPPLSDICSPKQGLASADNERFLRSWHEVSHSKTSLIKGLPQAKWFPIDKGGEFRRWYGNLSYVVNWEYNGKEMRNFPKSVIRNDKFYFKDGITWTAITSALLSVRHTGVGNIFSNAGMKVFADSIETLYLISGILNSKVCKCIIKYLSQTLNFDQGVICRIPIVEINNVDTILLIRNLEFISKLDWDAHETSWDFQTTPLFDAMLGEIGLSKSQFNHSRMVAKVREGVLLSDVYMSYTQQWEHLFMQLHANEEELNRQFIEIYGLQDELTPDVPFKEITILQKGEITIEDNRLVWHEDVVIKQFISYLVGCYMGRYSVDKPGLIIASQDQELSTLGVEVEGIDATGPSTIAIDDDGIIPFVQEPDFFADDMTQRIEAAIKKIFGEAHYHDNLKFINKAVGGNLREYLYKTFYTDHVQMYSKRPIYWLFSSKMGDKKKKGYFKALVYMHRLEPDTLSKLHADYVHPYIEKVEMQLKEKEVEASRDDLDTKQRNKAIKEADDLKAKVREVRAFEQQLVEMASHRLTIDLDDGVKVNYPKFYPLVETIKGLESSEE